MNPQPVDGITPQPRGWPPILLELDTKLIMLLLAIRTKGGVVNIHVVRAAAKALIESNPLDHILQNLKCPVLGYILFIDKWDSVTELAPQIGHLFPKGYLMHVKEIIFLILMTKE